MLARPRRRRSDSNRTPGDGAIIVVASVPEWQRLRRMPFRNEMYDGCSGAPEWSWFVLTPFVFFGAFVSKTKRGAGKVIEFRQVASTES